MHGMCAITNDRKVCFFFFFFFLIYLFIHSVLGLRFCARSFSSCGKRGPLFIAVCGPLTIAASLVAEHSLQTHRLSSCGSRAQLLRGMWDLPRPGLEPCPLHRQADSQPLRHQGSPKSMFLKKKNKNRWASYAFSWLTSRSLLPLRSRQASRLVVFSIWAPSARSIEPKPEQICLEKAG